MKKITLLFALAALFLTTGLNAQNYGMKTTGEPGDGFSSNEIGALLSNQTAFTIEFWYQVEVFKDNTWIFKVEASEKNRIGLLTAGADNGAIYVRIADGTNHGQQAFWNTGTTVGAGWNHVALTFDSGIHKLYINGVERTTGAGIGGTYPTSTGDLSDAQFQIGWTTGANVDELRITKGTALSAIDIAKSSHPENFDAYFDFDDNVRPVGEEGTNSAVANKGSDTTVKGQINNMGSTYEVTDNATLSIKAFDIVNNLQVYPNPTKDYVNIRWTNSTTAHVAIYNVTGKLLIQKDVVNQNDTHIDISTLAQGIYMLSVENDSHKTVSKLIVR